MHALIVAAGFGSRLRAVSPSKPLTAVAGVPLIERVVLTAREGGATGFTIVTGYEAVGIERWAAGAARLGLPIACVRTGDWTKPNGHSVLSGAAVIGRDRHLLMMADHLVEPALVATVLASPDALHPRHRPSPRQSARRHGRRHARPHRCGRADRRDRQASARLRLFDTGVFAVDGRFQRARAAGVGRRGRRRLDLRGGRGAGRERRRAHGRRGRNVVARRGRSACARPGGACPRARYRRRVGRGRHGKKTSRSRPEHAALTGIRRSILPEEEVADVE
ncbi:NTP transferase domain-containing protein [Sphingomonas sp. MMS24-JH45]